MKYTSKTLIRWGRAFGLALTIAVGGGSATLAQAEAPPLKVRYGEGSKMLEEFVVEQPAHYQTGAKLRFVMRGEPGGKAQVVMKLTKGSRTVALKETDLGVYEANYTLLSSDRFDKPTFSASLSKRGVVSEAWAQSSVSVAAAMTSTPATAHCAGCGRVLAVKESWEESAEDSVPGMVMGGVIGGLLGNQMGGGAGKDLATIAGAGAGAYAGNQVAKKLKHQIWHVEVKLDDGTLKTWKFKEAPAFGVGQRVRAGAEGKLEKLD